MNAYFANTRYRARPTSGVERYADEILRRLRTDITSLSPRRFSTGLAGHLWEQMVLPGQVGRGILWSPANTGPLSVAAQVLSLHDLGPIDHPEWYRGTFSAWYRWLWPRLVVRVQTVIADSRFTKERILDRFSLPVDKVRVVPVGVDGRRFRPWQQTEVERIRKKYGLPEPYVLFVGTVQPRKNLAGLVHAFTKLRREYPAAGLVVAGEAGGPFKPTSEPLGPGIRSIGRVPEADLPLLYSGAAVFVQPSFYEGAGLTLLEAMSCGCPVAAASGSALEEYLGGAGLTFDPRNPSEIAAKIAEILGDDDLRRAFQEAGYERARDHTWARSADCIDRELGAIRLQPSPV